MAIQTVSITGKILLPDGSAPASGSISVRLSQAGSVLDGATSQRVGAEIAAALGTDGSMPSGLALVPNDAITPSGTYYLVEFTAREQGSSTKRWTEKWQVPSGGPLDIGAVPRLDVVSGIAVSTEAAVSASVVAAAQSAQTGAEAARDTATAQASSAQAAKTSAETARDAANATGKVYATTAAGLAAVAEGEYFNVPSADASEFLALYRKTGGAAVEAKRYRLLESVITETAGKNKFDPSLAEDGKIYSYATGTAVAYADGIAFGRHPVQPGRTYTLSMPASEPGFTDVLFCYNAGGAFLGNHRPITTNPVAPLAPVVWWRDYGSNGWPRTATITIPSGSTVASVTVHSSYFPHATADFDRIRAAVQIEEGYLPTELEAYSADTTPRTKTANMTEDVIGSGLVKIQRAADLVYVRTRWSATRDLVQRLTMHRGATFEGNDVIDFTGVKLIPRTTTDAATATAYGSSAEVLAAQGDEAAPAYYNGTYIGANHGPLVGVQLTATAHGKTFRDVGSRWTDSSSRSYYIARVVDVNTLWVLSENIGTVTLWNFDVSLAGATLTHAAGATNTAAITFASPTQIQLYPVVQNRVKSILLDGRTPVTRDGVYAARSVDITESYDLPNMASAVAFLGAKVGDSTVYLNDARIATQSRMGMVYRFAPNGSCTVYHSFRAHQDLTLYYVGFIQQSVLNYSGKTLLQYVPKVNPIVGTLKTWNLAAAEDITTQIEGLALTSATWLDPNSPPDRMAQIVKNGSAREFGFILGYSPLRGVGAPATRKTLINDAGLLHTTRKMYPKGVTSGSTALGGGTLLSAGSYFEAVAYRAFFNSTVVPEATVFTWYYDGPHAVVLLDFHQNVTGKPIPLPSEFTGAAVTVVEKSASFTLQGGEMVSPDGLYVTVTGGYGYAVLKLAR
jgi:hypothetical protein